MWSPGISTRGFGRQTSPSRAGLGKQPLNQFTTVPLSENEEFSLKTDDSPLKNDEFWYSIANATHAAVFREQFCEEVRAQAVASPQYYVI